MSCVIKVMLQGPAKHEVPHMQSLPDGLVIYDLWQILISCSKYGVRCSATRPNVWHNMRPYLCLDA